MTLKIPELRLRPVLALVLAILGALSFTGCQKSESKFVPNRVSGPDIQASAVPVPTELSLRSLVQRIPVIMYHDIILERNRDSVWFDCTKTEFEDQIKLIKEQGYTPISLAQLYDHLTKGEQIIGKPIVLTFDDNYQGFYDIAWPIVKAEGFPVAMFVHTGFVGNKEGVHPKMGWDTLKELIKDPLFTVGSHTITHPDLPSLSLDQQQKELTESKATLEKELGIKIAFLAYPEGKNDPTSQSLAKEAGYQMSFSVANGPAEESPNIQCVNRYIHTRLEKAIEECELATSGGGAAFFESPLKIQPVAYREDEPLGKKLAIITGGAPMTITSDTREGVLDFMKRSGAVAGINGTFFAMAAVAATDNKLIGPSKTVADRELLPDPTIAKETKLHNRPVVIFGPTKVAIVPFAPLLMNEEPPYRQLMPDFTDEFLGGVWLVHNGIAADEVTLKTFGSKDIQDPRRRAAFGLTSDGVPVAAASKDSVSSSDFAEMLSAVGIKEAVLLDSGFSTSLVYGEKIMASGHSTPDKPSRPVPHAILFKGELDPASKAIADAAVPATNRDAKDTPRRRRRKRAAP